MDSHFKPFHEMQAEDYAEIGLRCGLEIHQQLLTEKKLFCRCPAGRYTKDYDAEILRHMRPTLSELGEYDGTALMEKKTKKNIHYRIHHETVCTYEFDDTPPFLINESALDIAIEIALLLRLNMVSELHIARKQYLDGSIPTGFQRTTILGVDGWIPYKDRKIRIRQLGLEEDACREVSDEGHDRVYRTDRLGMALVEPVTYPDMRTPEEAADVAQILRKLCRSTGKVRTGAGAAREDVNVSVAGGTRVEIKGVSKILQIPHLIYNEASRQCALLRIRDILKSRGITPDTIECQSHDVTRVLSKAQYEPIRAAVSEGATVRCVVIKGFAGILDEPTQEATVFASEFSDRVRVIACLTRLPNIIHSDSASESLSARDWKALRKRTGTGDGDTMILVWGSEMDTRTACDEIRIRATEAATGVPSDTRQAHQDGTNGFERVLPGADRMYPDTDLPPIVIDPTRVRRVKSQLPEYVWDREERCRQAGLPEAFVHQLSLSRRGELFLRIVNELQINPTFAAIVLCQRFKAFCREGLQPDRLTDDIIFDVFKAHADGQVAREGVVKVLRHCLADCAQKSPTIDVSESLSELNLEPIHEQEIAQRIVDCLQLSETASFGTLRQKHRYLMGQLMAHCRGRIDGAKVAELLGASLGTEWSLQEA
ncbi:MAG: Glu-tRNA(Gln) amidotransferase subunit GatE [Phycisphaerales bacterium]|nr:MAG: Glu-tRNA(Gln) amidotransferase subunit GatE [Phycisphaerales bacterium]